MFWRYIEANDMFLIFLAFVFTTHIRITASHKSKEDVLWPEGTYGLPKAKEGCSKTDKFAWNQGTRLQTLDSNSSKNSEQTMFSNPFHMDVSLQRQFLLRSFCIKSKPCSDGAVKRKWPRGSYCIYKYGNCPSGMLDGYIFWDDANRDNVNQQLGTLPNGYKEHGNTKIYYCCQNQSSWYNVIELPITSSFYLLPYKTRSQANAKCQRVKWAIATMEYIRYNTEDEENMDEFVGHHVAVNKTMKTCQNKMDASNGIFKSFRNKNGYPSYQSCSWLIRVEESFIVSVNFTSLYISDCEENFLKIYDGASEGSRIIATYCGFPTPRDVAVFSTGTDMYVVLKSGDISHHLNYSFGFEARYGPLKIVSTPPRSPHNVEVIGLTFASLFLIFIVVALVIGYRKSPNNEENELTSRFHVPSTIPLETLPSSALEIAPSHKETNNPYYVTAKLWDDSSLSRSSDNVAYVTSPELNHGYMDASGTGN